MHAHYRQGCQIDYLTAKLHDSYIRMGEASMNFFSLLFHLDGDCSSTGDDSDGWNFGHKDRAALFSGVCI